MTLALCLDRADAPGDPVIVRCRLHDAAGKAGTDRRRHFRIFIENPAKHGTPDLQDLRYLCDADRLHSPDLNDKRPLVDQSTWPQISALFATRRGHQTLCNDIGGVQKLTLLMQDHAGRQ